MNAEAITTVIGSIAVLGGFWVWARRSIVKTIAATETLKSRADGVDRRCKERRADIHAIYEKIDDLRNCVAKKDSETAKAVGRLEGKMDTLLKGAGR